MKNPKTPNLVFLAINATPRHTVKYINELIFKPYIFYSRVNREIRNFKKTTLHNPK